MIDSKPAWLIVTPELIAKADQHVQVAEALQGELLASAEATIFPALSACLREFFERNEGTTELNLLVWEAAERVPVEPRVIREWFDAFHPHSGLRGWTDDMKQRLGWTALVEECLFWLGCQEVAPRARHYRTFTLPDVHARHR